MGSSQTPESTLIFQSSESKLNVLTENPRASQNFLRLLEGGKRKNQ